jgi:hypothetical protein
MGQGGRMDNQMDSGKLVLLVDDSPVVADVVQEA